MPAICAIPAIITLYVDFVDIQVCYPFYFFLSLMSYDHYIAEFQPVEKPGDEHETIGLETRCHAYPRYPAQKEHG